MTEIDIENIIYRATGGATWNETWDAVSRDLYDDMNVAIVTSPQWIHRDLAKDIEEEINV